MATPLDCPVDRVLINENKARMVAGIVVILVSVFLVYPSILLMAFLIMDFAIRATIYGKYSVLGFLAERLLPVFKIPNKPTDRAPKRFASGVGLIFSVFILLFYLFQIMILAYGLSIILIAFAILESVFGFCAGCYVYSFLKKWGVLNWN
jgi:hypothetical protein